MNAHFGEPTIVDSAVVALTETGRTPAMMSRVRSGIPIYALSRSAHARTWMALMRDVYPVSFDLAAVTSSGQLLKAVVLHLVQIGVLSKRDVFLLTHGDDIMIQGKTSTLKVYRVSDILAKDTIRVMHSIDSESSV